MGSLDYLIERIKSLLNSIQQSRSLTKNFNILNLRDYGYYQKN